MRHTSRQTRIAAPRAAVVVIATLCAAMFAACGDGGEDGRGGRIDSNDRFELATRDSAGVAIITTNLQATEHVCSIGDEPDVRIGDDDDNPDELLDSIRGVDAFPDGGFAVASGRHELRTYDADGGLTGQHLAEGAGPSEFQNAFLVNVTRGDSVWVGSYVPWGYLVFDRAAVWQRRVTVEPQVLNSPEASTVLDNGLIVMSRIQRPPLSPSFQDKHLLVEVYDRNGILADSLGRYVFGKTAAFSDLGMIVSGLFGPEAGLASHGNTVAVGTGLSPEIRVYTVGRDGAVLSTILRWPARGIAVENSHVTLDHERLRQQYVNVPEDLRAKLLAVMNNPDRPVADVFPEFESLIYGTDGRLWLRDYERPGDTRHRWAALDPSGALACVLETPVFDEIAAFGPDFMVVVEDLEDGREVVSRYRITP